MLKVHEFDSSGQAYDRCQCDSSISDGDILLISSECVVGVAWTWPTAVTQVFGELHSLSGTGNPWADHEKENTFREGWSHALALAREKGWDTASYNPFP